MDIVQLQYFHAVAETGHLTKAAEEMNVSQSTVSMALLRLEEELNVRLFEKEGRKKVLTQAGIQFLRHVDSILDELDIAKSELSMSSLKFHVLRLATDSTEAISLGQTTFLKRSPNVIIQQDLIPTEMLVNRLLRREIDLGFAQRSLDSKDIISTPFYSERVGLLVSCEHRFASRSCVKMAELKDEPFITMGINHSYRDMFDSFCRQANFRPMIRAETIHNQGLQMMVTANLGVAFVSDGMWFGTMASSISFFGNHENALRIIPIEEDYCKRTFYMSRLRNRKLDEATSDFFHFMLDFYPEIEKIQKKEREKMGWM